MRNPHGDFVWYELMSRDPDGAKTFYDQVVGWTVEAQSQFPNGYRMIGIGDGRSVGGILPLTDAMCEHGARAGWYAYVGVDDVDATVTKARSLGAAIPMEGQDIPGVGRIAMIADPQGNHLYLMRGAMDERSDVFSPDKPLHVSWNELQTTDLEAAKVFYPALFGWSLGDVMPMGEMGDYQFLDHGGRMIGAMMTAPPGARGGWGFAFRVTDLDSATARIAPAGGTVVQGPMDIPGDERAVMASDPEGAPFMLVGK